MSEETDRNNNGEMSKLTQKMKDDPLVPIGLLGLAGVVGYSMFNLKNKKMKLSLYLIHTRVAAQGTLMACLTLGLIYTITKDNLSKLFPDKKN